MATILVTGAGGFLGRYIAPAAMPSAPGRAVRTPSWTSWASTPAAAICPTLTPSPTASPAATR